LPTLAAFPANREKQRKNLGRRQKTQQNQIHGSKFIALTGKKSSLPTVVAGKAGRVLHRFIPTHMIPVDFVAIMAQVAK
jgi:hypothetical protein